jgi:hypothetical protein
MYKVRMAVMADVPYLACIVGRDMCSLLGEAELYDEEQMTFVLKNMVAAGHVIVVDDGEFVVGAMGAVFTPWLWNPSVTTLSETFWWVREDRRNGRIGYLLLKEFEQVGRAGGAKRLVMTTLPSTTTSLSKLGYVVRELALVKEI